MRRLAALLVGALAIFGIQEAWSGLAVSGVSNDLNNYSSDNRKGIPAPGGDSCVSGMSCAAIVSNGDSTDCDFTASGDDLTVTRLPGGSGACFGGRTFAVEGDWQAKFCFNTANASGNVGLYAAVNAVIIEGPGSNWSTEYLSRMTRHVAGTTSIARFDANTSGTPAVSNTVPASTCYAAQYRASDNRQSLWDDNGTAGVSWYMRASTTANEITSGRIGLAFFGASTASAATATVTDFAIGNTLDLVDASTPPPDPDLPDALTFPNRPGGPPWRSGMGSIRGNEATTYTTWIGHQPDLMTVWFGYRCMNTWARLARGAASDNCNGVYLTDAMQRLPVTAPIVISMPMRPHDGTSPDGTVDTEDNKSTIGCNASDTTDWDTFAAVGTALGSGPYDGYWTTWATNLRNKAIANNRDPANHIVRLGWEMNGDWYPWSICNKAVAFKASWVRVVSLVRAVIPGIPFDFSPAKPYVNYLAGRVYQAGGPCDLECFYPGDNYVTYISKSFHDNNPIIVDEDTWDHWVNPPASERIVGLQEALDVAIAHRKWMVFSEWSVNYAPNCDASGVASPQPAFVMNKMYEWLTAIHNIGYLGFETYFAPSCADPSLNPTRQAGPGPTMHKTRWNQSAPIGLLIPAFGWRRRRRSKERKAA